MPSSSSMASKRRASRSPESRASKKRIPSSPEEGELDDPSPPAPSEDPLASADETKSTVKKFKFPFKTKSRAEPTMARPPPPFSDAHSGPAVYDRSPEDDKRFREQDPKKRSSSSSSRYNGGDHWEPDSSSRPRDSRKRRRSSSSRSPTSPHRDTHRLPPPRDEYDSDYGRGHGGGGSRRRYPDDEDRYGGARAWSDNHYYRPRDDSREWTRRVEPFENNERQQGGRGYDRDFHSGRGDHYASGSDRHSSRYMHGGDSYRPGPSRAEPPRPSQPHSPPHSPPRSPRSRASASGYDARDREWPKHTDMHAAFSPPSTALAPPELPLGPRTPPPPTIAPPPPPPPDARLSRQAMPNSHRSVSIAFKRPQLQRAPLLPPPTNFHGALSSQKTEETPPSSQTPRERPVRKIVPVRRSREEEKKVYNRVFRGCGEQEDYEVTTKLGEGTFGEVHKAIQKGTRRPVALKRILMHNEKEGMPVTALREIKILKALKHPCIIDILDMFVVRSNDKDPLSVYMVFPYMDHDLAGLLENDRVKLQPSQIKLYMKQLLEGTEYMHRNNILHRDMKAANLLISNEGQLRIADFGLARSFDPQVTHGGKNHRGREYRYTNCVVTRWYRPPELLLGATQYGGEIDIWGIGCVLAEMFNRRPILQGTSDLDQLERIWKLCGTPTQHTWLRYDDLPGCNGVKRFPTPHSRCVKQHLESRADAETCDFLDKLLVCNPKDRLTASQALDHDYFWTDPLPADPKSLPRYEASHEFDKRQHHRPPPAPMAPPAERHRPVPPSNRPGPSSYGGLPQRPTRLPPPLHLKPGNRGDRGGRYQGPPRNNNNYRPQPSSLPPPPPSLPRPPSHISPPAHLPPRPMDPPPPSEPVMIPSLIVNGLRLKGG